ncbi:MAG: hypothetical protein J6J39_04400 [Clostridia bacterium]|nr:hypothetical protein [Clostridia bacterium]
MIKRIVTVFLLSLCFIITVSADSATVFSVNCADADKETFFVNIETDTISGVGGIDFTLNYDSSFIKVKKSSVKCSLPRSEVIVNEGSIRVLWDTTEKVNISQVLLSAEFENEGLRDASQSFNLSFNDYYDNTLELNDIPYTVTYFATDEVQKVKVNPWGTVFKVLGMIIGAVVIMAVGYYFYQTQKIEQTAKYLADSKGMC